MQGVCHFKGGLTSTGPVTLRRGGVFRKSLRCKHLRADGHPPGPLNLQAQVYITCLMCETICKSLPHQHLAYLLWVQGPPQCAGTGQLSTCFRGPLVIAPVITSGPAELSAAAVVTYRSERPVPNRSVHQLGVVGGDHCHRQLQLLERCEVQRAK